MDDKLAVMVNGRRYLISCTPDRVERLEMLGRQLDGRMRDLSRTLGDIGNESLFFALGLALLDEMDAADDGSDDASSSARRAVRVLSDAASRVEAIADRLEAGMS